MAMLPRKLRLPPVKVVREALVYDPHMGEFFWRWRPSSHFGNNGDVAAGWNIAHAGAQCGSKTGGTKGNHYLGIKVNNVLIHAHLIAWAIMTGEWPEHSIDHINCIRLDNRWCNLRAATRQQQSWNRATTKRRRLGKLKGVYREVNRFKAQIRINGKVIRLGSFATEEEAHAAWKAAAQKLHGEFFNPG